LADERLEGGLVNVVFFMDVDRAACVSVETRVEQTGRILQRGMSLRILLRVSPRQSPSSTILFEMSADANWP
jgi:hypothetical protein